MGSFEESKSAGLEISSYCTQRHIEYIYLKCAIILYGLIRKTPPIHIIIVRTTRSQMYVPDQGVVPWTGNNGWFETGVRIVSVEKLYMVVLVSALRMEKAACVFDNTNCAKPKTLFVLNKVRSAFEVELYSEEVVLFEAPPDTI